MIKSLRPYLILSIACCSFIQLKAQHVFKFNTGVLDRYQDSLVRMGEEVYTTAGNQQRFAKNALLIKTLVNALKQPNSFAYEFDSLKSISVLKSPDKSFRIFSWQVPVDGGTYRYFGTIQMATPDGKLKLYPLIDETDNLKDDNQLTTNKNWYGARYYEIVPVVLSGKQNYYALLGWKGHTSKVSRKVIEILSFNKDGAIFGKSVFDGSKSSSGRNRIVFEYSKLNAMTLLFDKSVNMIVYDHLAPISPDVAGNFEYYASDLSFDAYKVIGGRLKLQENVELKNDPNELDELYIDPNDKNIPTVKKY